MKRMFLLLILCYTSISFCQGSATAREERRIGFGAQVGYFNPADADKGGVMGGILAQAKFTRYLGGQISLNYRHEKYADGLVTIKSWPFLFSVLLFPLDQVHGMIGMGVYSTTFDYPDFMIGGMEISDETLTKVGFHFGAGVSFPLGDGFRVTSDILYHLLGYELKEVEQVQTASDVNADYLSIMAGFMFEF